MSMELVAVYGSLRKGLHNHPMIKGGNLLGYGTVSGYKMYSIGSFDSYPYIVPSGKEEDKIVVEVYEIPPHIYSSVHAMEFGAGYDYEYIDIPEIGEATLYIMGDYIAGTKQIPDGDWAKYKGFNNYFGDTYNFNLGMDSVFDDDEEEDVEGFYTITALIRKLCPNLTSLIDKNTDIGLEVIDIMENMGKPQEGKEGIYIIKLLDQLM